MSWQTEYNRSKVYHVELSSGPTLTLTCGASNCSCSDTGYKFAKVFYVVILIRKIPLNSDFINSKYSIYRTFAI